MQPFNRQQTKRYWDLEESTTAEGKPAGELYLYGTIYESGGGIWGDPDDVTPKALATSLQALGEISELNVHIFSSGGDVFAGNAIYSLLKQRKEIVNVYVEGIAASIASVIAMAGDTVYIAKTAMFMIHNPMCFLFGLFNKIDMAKYISELERVWSSTMPAYTDKTGLAPEKIQAMLDANGGDGTYLTADEAVSLGFADAITPDGKVPLEMAAMIKPNVYSCRGHLIDMSNYKNPPQLPAVRAKQKGKMQMAKTKATKFKAELLSIECPHCHTVLDFDTTPPGLVTTKPEEGATVAVPMEAKRTGKNYRNELFKIICPECGGEFEYETEPDLETGVIPPDAPGAGANEPIPQAQRVTRVKAVKKTRMQAPDPNADPNAEPVAQTNEVPVTCTECATEFTIDVDPAITSATVVCPNCQAELTVDTTAQEPAQPPAPDTAAVVAMRKGIAAERKRLEGLDDVAKAFPQFANAIDGFKHNGSSVECAHKWVFKALAANPPKTGGYAAASRRDAQVLGKIGTPAASNSKSASIEEKVISLAKRRGVWKDG